MAFSHQWESGRTSRTSLVPAQSSLACVPALQIILLQEAQTALLCVFITSAVQTQDIGCRRHPCITFWMQPTKQRQQRERVCGTCWRTEPSDTSLMNILKAPLLCEEREKWRHMKEGKEIRTCGHTLSYSQGGTEFKALPYIPEHIQTW